MVLSSKHYTGEPNQINEEQIREARGMYGEQEEFTQNYDGKGEG